jgi:DNA repair ATPase RecN
MSTKTVNIESLLKKRDQIQNKAIQGALAKMEERKQLEQEERILENLGKIQGKTEEAVNLLRKARSNEKAAKTYLQSIADAEQAFYTDANYESYQTKLQTAVRDYNRSYRH